MKIRYFAIAGIVALVITSAQAHSDGRPAPLAQLATAMGVN